MMAKAADYTLQNAPILLLPRLAHFCPTPASQLALLGVYIGLHAVIAPLQQMLGSLMYQRFVAEQTVAERLGLAQMAAGKAELWTDTSVADACQQQMLDVAASKSLFKANLLSSVPEVALGALFGLWGMATLPAVSPMAAGLMATLALAPTVVSIYSSDYRAKVELQVANARKDLLGHLGTFWDNITVGGTQNHLRWQNRLTTYTQDVATATWRQHALQHLCRLVERFPQRVINGIIYSNNFLAMAFPGQPPLISNTLQKSFGSATSLMNAAMAGNHAVAAFQALKRKTALLNNLKDQLQRPADLSARMTLSDLTLRSEREVLTAQQVLQDASLIKKPGLWTLQAENGSGKTTFLAYCKARLGQDALFLPAKHRIDFGVPPGSSGEVTLAIMDHIDQEKQKPKVLLLDEWNANLSLENEVYVAAKIARWSQSLSVVQVTHH